MNKFSRTVFTAITFSCLVSVVSGQCLVDDTLFTTADGGCKDLATGLVWAADTSAAQTSGNGVYGNSVPFLPCENLNEQVYGGFTDWRAPTAGEIEDSITNGLNTHLDFFLDGSNDDGRYRWTDCTRKVKGTRKRYKLRYSDGDLQLVLSDGASVTCVRGLPADPANDCLGKTKGGGKGRGNNRSSDTLSQATTGATLLAPLALAGVVCFARRRKP